MNPSPAEVFVRNPDLEVFRKTLVSFNGDFPFETEDMIRLGEAYLKRYPERFHNRDMAAVHIGYALVRICVMEKMVRSFPAEKRDLLRAAFQEIARIPAAIAEIAALSGVREAECDAAKLASELDTVKASVEEIPKGMIKERFMGGISALYNILYLVRFHLAKLTPPS
jgi:hypothetical protein